MLTPQLAVNQWVQLPQDTRRRLVEMFHIKRSGGAEVANGVLLTDGHTYRDLAVISTEAMQQLLVNQSSNFFELFDALLVKVEEEKQADLKAKREKHEAILEVKQQEIEGKVVEAVAEMTELVKTVRRGRPKKVTD